MIKILRLSKNTGLPIEQSNAKQDGRALKWPLWCFDALLLDRHQCQKILRFVKMSANILWDGGRRFFAFFPPNSFIVLTPFPSMTHSHLSSSDRNSWWTYAETHTAPYLHKKRKGSKVSAAPTPLMALTFNELCECMHDAEWEWIGFKWLCRKIFYLSESI